MKAVFILFIFALCLCSHVIFVDSGWVLLPDIRCSSDKMNRSTCYDDCMGIGHYTGGSCDGVKCYCTYGKDDD
ncbi:hypothetical protein C0J52_20463 [Blattella germanica]|nr:hypothetical protein C0J52_20463 [Blattella germanica]